MGRQVTPLACRRTPHIFFKWVISLRHYGVYCGNTLLRLVFALFQLARKQYRTLIGLYYGAPAKPMGVQPIIVVGHLIPQQEGTDVDMHGVLSSGWSVSFRGDDYFPAWNGW